MLTNYYQYYFKKHPASLWLGVYFLLCLILILPFLHILLLALGNSDDIWQHIWQTKLPTYIINSALLSAGVAVGSVLLGTGSAWLISRYAFWGKKYWEWLLLLPLAMPPYIIAFIYVDFFEYAGFIQVHLRQFFGWQSPSDYWFFEIRSLPAAIIILSFVLYPYIYIFARQAFRKTPYSLVETALLHNKNIFWRVALPMARTFIMAGLALVIMETLADFGAVDFFAVETLTLGIFNIWLGMHNLPVAAQIALLLVLFIIILLWVEQYYRHKQSFYDTSKKMRHMPTVYLSPFKQILCHILCFIPIFIGFLLPLLLLLSFAIQHDYTNFIGDFLNLFSNSIYIALWSAFGIICIAFFMAITAHYKGRILSKNMANIASMGYGFPGVILAIGVLSFVGFIDDAYRFTLQLLGLDNTRASLLQGTIFVLFLGYLTRFLAIGYNTVKANIARLSPYIMEANAVMAHSFIYGVYRLLIPLLKSSFWAGFLLLFVEIMKELPMTLLLSPFDFSNLATYTYQYAKDEMLQEASLPAITIVVSGLLPIIILNKLLRRDLE